LKKHRYPILILLVFYTLLVFGQNIDQRSIKDIEWVVANDMKISRAPGAVIAVLKNDSLIYQKAFGLSNSKTKSPINTSTLFLMASVTKVFTTTALLILCEKNNIDLNTPVGDIIDNLSPKLSNLTIHQILSQSSGMLDHWPTRKKFKNDLHTYFTHYGDKLINENLESVFSYTNFGHVLAGYLLEKLNTSTYQEAMDALIFKPLQMNSSTFDVNIAKLNNYTTGHIKGKSVAHKLTYPLIQPSASLFSNVHDLSRYAMCFMNAGVLDNQQIISKSVIEKMSKNYTPIGVLKVYFGYPKSSYNYGMIGFNFKGIEFLGHPGESVSQNILFAMVPKHKTAFMLLSNTGYYPFIDTFKKLAATFLPLQENFEEKIEPSNNYKELIGSYYAPNIYRNKDDIITIKNREKGLFIHLSEEEIYPLKEVGKNRFQYKNANIKFPMEIIFYTDNNGEIKYLNHFWRTLIKK